MSFSISSSSVSGKAGSLGYFALTMATIMLVAFGASEYLLRSQIVPQDDFLAHARLLQSSQKSDAIFGDSHAARGFVPDKNMVNLAYPSEGIEHMGWKIRRYFANKKPGRIVLQADPHLLAPYRLAGSLEGYAEKFDAALNGNGWMPLVFVARYRANLVNYWSSFFKSGGSLKSRIRVLPNGALLSPGNLARVNERSRLVAARSRIKTHKIKPSTGLEHHLQSYRETLDYLKDKGATICMVTYPLSPDYLAALDVRQSLEEKQNRRTILAFFRSQAKRVGATYVDLQAQITDRNKFRDVDHLNGGAAVKYSPGFINQCFG